MSKMSVSQNVLIIGNGVAGSRTAAYVRKVTKKSDVTTNITVLSAQDYTEIPVNMGMVIGAGREAHDKAIHPLLKEEGVTYHIGVCKEMRATEAVTEKGETLPFDVCIVATGQKMPTFMPSTEHATMEARKNFIGGLHDQIKDGQNIVIGGGGAIGCELAADIKLRHKDKSVTIVHSQETVLTAMNSGYHPIAAKALVDMGIVLKLSDRVLKQEGKKVELKSGGTLPCDVYISCFPQGGTASFMPKDALDDKGYVKVSDTFQVTGMDTVFAFGDCCNYDPIKTFTRITDQQDVLFHNVMQSLRGGKMKSHVRATGVMGQVKGPMMVALGHGAPGSVGLGPDLPGCLGSSCWCFLGACCCMGYPCSLPHGTKVAKTKADFNNEILPIVGRGIEH